MRKLGLASLLAMALLVISAAPSLAWSRGGHFHGHFHGGSRVFIGVGPGWWGWGGYPYPYYPYYYPPYYYTPPVVQEPSVYVQQGTPAAPPPPPAAPESSYSSYWYYCPSARDYYPSVPTCSEAWIKVPPRQD